MRVNIFHSPETLHLILPADHANLNKTVSVYSHYGTDEIRIFQCITMNYKIYICSHNVKIFPKFELTFL
jgi:hypothetical protein